MDTKLKITQSCSWNETIGDLNDTSTKTINCVLGNEMCHVDIHCLCSCPNSTTANLKIDLEIDCKICGNDICESIKATCSTNSPPSSIVSVEFNLHCSLAAPSSTLKLETNDRSTTITSSQQEQLTSATGMQSDPADSPTGDQKWQKTSKDLIIGVVVGGVLGIALITGLVLFIILRRRRLRSTSRKMYNSAPTPNKANVNTSLNCASLASHDNTRSLSVPIQPSTATMDNSETTSNEESGYSCLNNSGTAPLAPYDNIGALPVSKYPSLYPETFCDNEKVKQSRDFDKSFGNVKKEDQLADYAEAVKVTDNIRDADETVVVDNTLYDGHAVKTSPSNANENETILIENDLYQR